MSNDIKVMVVEDDPMNLKLMKMLLQKNNFVIYACTDAEQALEVLNTETPDVILMDLGLPGMNGLELTEKLKKNTSSVLRNIKIIALTAYARDIDRERAIQAGCDGFISKPINIYQIIDDIRKLVLGAHKSSSGASAN